jgi:hypothetical protein
MTHDGKKSVSSRGSSPATRMPTATAVTSSSTC